jgi:hypothetical protein
LREAASSQSTTQADGDSATYTLYESGGKRVLQLDGVVKPARESRRI